MLIFGSSGQLGLYPILSCCGHQCLVTEQSKTRFLPPALLPLVLSKSSSFHQDGRVVLPSHQPLLISDMWRLSKLIGQLLSVFSVQ